MYVIVYLFFIKLNMAYQITLSYREYKRRNNNSIIIMKIQNKA